VASGGRREELRPAAARARLARRDERGRAVAQGGGEPVASGEVDHLLAIGVEGHGAGDPSGLIT
jgi:hypothetical protein